MPQGGRPDAHARLGSSVSDTELLSIALGFEQEQLALQKGMGDLPGDTHLDIIDQVIDEERRHLVQLGEARQNL